MTMKYLAGITDLPYVTPTGRVITRAGWDEETCLYLHLVPYEWQGVVPERLTPQTVAQMLSPWAAYHFAGPDDAAGMVSAVLAAVCRQVLDLCPAVLFDAATQGSGKTKAACALGALIEGRRPSVTPYAGSSTDDEMRKRLVAGAIDGVRFQCLDNITGHFKSSVLASVLTTGRLSDRVLGQSRTVDVGVRSLLTLTGNNASLDADMQRRMVHVRIDGGTDPTHKAFEFDPISEALRQRRVIAVAACTVLRAYFAAGAPDIVAGDAGGFSAWNRLCRQPVLWLQREGLADGLPWGLGDPAASMLADVSQSDPEIEALADMLRGLNALTDGEPFSSADAAAWFEIGEHHKDEASGQFRAAVKDLTGARESGSRHMGQTLKNRRDRRAGGLKLLAGGRDYRGSWWRVVAA